MKRKIKIEVEAVFFHDVVPFNAFTNLQRKDGGGQRKGEKRWEGRERERDKGREEKCVKSCR